MFGGRHAFDAAFLSARGFDRPSRIQGDRRTAFDVARGAAKVFEAFAAIVCGVAEGLRLW